MTAPRIWSRDDFDRVAQLVFPKSRIFVGGVPDAIMQILSVMEATEAALAAGGALDAASVIWPAQKGGGAPKVWSRDDFMEACRLCGFSFAKDTAEKANAILEMAERNMRGRLPQPRDAKGHFQSPSKLPTLDSPLVISARAGE